MANLSPEQIALLGFLSAIGVEIAKDTGKHLGRKAKELYDSIQPDIIELGINKDDNKEVIQQKLDTKPEKTAEIQQKIAANQDGFKELLEFMKENLNNNEINIENRNISGKSKVKTSIHQGNNYSSINKGGIILGIVGIVAITLAIVAMVLGLPVILNFISDKNSNHVTNANTNTESTANNTESNVTPQNVNGLANNVNGLANNVSKPANKTEPNRSELTYTPNKSPTPRPSQLPIKPKTQKKTIPSVEAKKEFNPNSNATPSPCSLTPHGCGKSKKETNNQ